MEEREREVFESEREREREWRVIYDLKVLKIYHLSLLPNITSIFESEQHSCYTDTNNEHTY